MNYGKVNSVGNNRDEFIWEENKKPPVEELSDFVDSLSSKIDEYIEQKAMSQAAELVYGATANVYGSSIFVHFDELSVQFELKDLLAESLRQCDNHHHLEDKQADIDELLPLLRTYVKELEEKQKVLDTNAN